MGSRINNLRRNERELRVPGDVDVRSNMGDGTDVAEMLENDVTIFVRTSPFSPEFVRFPLFGIRFLPIEVRLSVLVEQ